MTTTIQLPESTDKKLNEYCKVHGITKGEAVRRALDFFLEEVDEPTPYELGKDGFGADKTHGGDIARHSKQLLRDKFRGKTNDR
jgi:predicted DNA-binding protein